ncbi:DUF2935 domain-containing protein [Bacillus sp. FJAT-45350]|uniref:DUF2935 domain-containing protein n=1 Tax=Bacillus sp. FJAT-45350 TaxID=2011014 RepID=UPI000BB91649|nr:DUF2935 domain-containing protein [Bacillus sp. FJAT-45350]
MQNFTEAALFEHRFWLQILGDHARFIRDTLSPLEEEKIQEALAFIEVFDQILQYSQQSLTNQQLKGLTQQAYEQAKEIRHYKLTIIEEHLVGNITIELPPTFLNHMVNEVDEYLRILPFLLEEKHPPICHSLHHHLVWLLDAAGHADAITGSLDLVEKKLSKRSEYYTETFEHFYIKAVEMAGYLRANVHKFPALNRFNEQVELEISLFKAFLDEMEELEMTDRVLSTLSPLMADHMAREECYYLTKLAESSDLSQPDCDPTSPRSEY